MKSTSCRAPQPIGSPVRSLARDLRVAAHQPHGQRVRRRAEDDVDAARVRAVEDRLEPVQLEPALVGLPRGPHRLPDADHREARRRMRSRSRSRVSGRGRRPARVLVVVGGAEADAIGRRGCSSLPLMVRGGTVRCQPLTLPVARPDCQYRCRNRNAMISGMIETNEPVITRREQGLRAAAGATPRPAAARDPP